MGETNFPKKSPRNSTNHEWGSETINDLPTPNTAPAVAPAPGALPDAFWEKYFDHSFDMVARVRAAKERAQRAIEEFGDPSEYDVYVLRDGKWVPADQAQAGSGKTSIPTSTAVTENYISSDSQTNAKKSESER